jgi:hypothetical protein
MTKIYIKKSTTTIKGRTLNQFLFIDEDLKVIDWITTDNKEEAVKLFLNSHDYLKNSTFIEEAPQPIKPTQYKALLRRAGISVNDFDFILNESGSVVMSISNFYYGKGGRALGVLRKQLERSLAILNLLGFEAIESNQFYDTIIIFESFKHDVYNFYKDNPKAIEVILKTNNI